jgi:hypothetical protein
MGERGRLDERSESGNAERNEEYGKRRGEDGKVEEE